MRQLRYKAELQTPTGYTAFSTRYGTVSVLSTAEAIEQVEDLSKHIWCMPIKSVSFYEGGSASPLAYITYDNNKEEVKALPAPNNSGPHTCDLYAVGTYFRPPTFGTLKLED